MSVFKYVHFPVNEADTTKTILFRPASDIIAINPDKLEDGFLEMTTADLAACSKYGERFVCNINNVITRNDSDSCVYALYTRNLPAARTACPIHLVESKDAIVQLGLQPQIPCTKFSRICVPFSVWTTSG